MPTLFQVKNNKGEENIIMFSGLYPIRMASTQDHGKTWSELRSIGNFGGIVAMSTMIQDQKIQVITERYFMTMEGLYMKNQKTKSYSLYSI